jgi:hypothetical protein
MKRLIIIIIIGALAGTKTSAQPFETSDATAPKWYFIQVKGSGDNAGKVLAEIDGAIVGRPAETGLAARATQLWRLEAVPNTEEQCEIINKHTGKKLDVFYDAAGDRRIAVASETPSTRWTIRELSGNYFSLRIVTQPEGGISGAVYLTIDGTDPDPAFYFTRNAPNTNSEAQFQFISVDIPTVSDERETAWFTIRNAQNDLSGKCLAELETAADTKLSLQDFDAVNLRQQWKIVANPASEGSVNFVNRETEHLISTSPLYGFYDYLPYADTETTGWTINKLEDNQYEVHTGRLEAGKYWYAATEGRIADRYAKGASLNTGFAWKFQLRDEDIYNAIKLPEQDNVRIYAKDRRICVEGTDRYRIHTIYGTPVNKNRELPTGIYLVTVKNKTTKILVR